MFKRSIMAACIVTAAITSSAPVMAEDTTLKFFSWDTGPDGLAAYKAVARGFEKTHLGVKVIIETANTNDDMSILKIRLSGGQGPDVFGVRPSLTPDLVKGGFLTTLENEPWFANLNIGARNAPNAHQDDSVYAVAIAQAGEGIVYNTELFEQAGIHKKPGTFSELLSAAEALHANGVTPFAMSSADNWWPQFILYHLTAQNVSHLDPTANADLMSGARKFSDVPGWRTTLEQYVQLIPYFMPNSNGTSQSAAQAAFLQGKAAMFPAAWILPEVRKVNLPVDYFNFPATEDANIGSIWGGYPIQLGINPKNGNSEVASEFIGYLLSPEVYPGLLAGISSYSVVDGISRDNEDALVPTLQAAWQGKMFQFSPPDTWLPGVQNAMLAGVQELTGGKASVDDVLAAMDAATAEALSNQ